MPKVVSRGECEFALHCRAYNLTPEREYLFHPTRKFRFDFAFPAEKLAVEIEGLTREGGRHQRRSGYTVDCVKYSEAAVLGWRVIRATTAQVTSGQAIDWTLAALRGCDSLNQRSRSVARTNISGRNELRTGREQS
jgi:very-short-patch-repair endonuclease